MPLMDCFGNHEYCPQQVIVVLFIAMFTDLPDIDPSMKCRKASRRICRHFPVQMHVNKLHYHDDRKQFIRSGRCPAPVLSCIVFERSVVVFGDVERI